MCTSGKQKLRKLFFCMANTFGILKRQKALSPTVYNCATCNCFNVQYIALSLIQYEDKYCSDTVTTSSLHHVDYRNPTLD
jgi:hypothetical protein